MLQNNKKLIKQGRGRKCKLINYHSREYYLKLKLVIFLLNVLNLIFFSLEESLGINMSCYKDTSDIQIFLQFY